MRTVICRECKLRPVKMQDIMHFDDQMSTDDIIFYSVLYSSLTVIFAMAVLSKFLTNEFRFGFRSCLSLVVLFLGEPLCQFMLKGPGGVMTFAVGCLMVYSILPASHLPAANKSVLITGCDSGFGNSLVKKLDLLGMNVYAGCLFTDGPGAIELQNTCSNRLQLLKLDVTSKHDINNAVELISGKVGEDGLWGLVNNAGVWYFSELETTSDKILQNVLDVNLYGPVRITRAMLPLIRQAKGRVINVSSMSGRLSMEGTGAYGMSKHALVAFADTLRLEMHKWGVRVSIVEPAGFLTGNMSEQALRQKQVDIWDSLDKSTQDAYGKEYFDAIYSHLISSFATLPTDLTPVVRAIRSGLLSKRPRARYPCGTGAEFVMLSYLFLPIWLADKLSAAIGIMPKNVRPAALSPRIS